MTNLAYERLHENLIKLKLNTVGTILDNYLEIAAKEGKTTLEVLDYLVDQEKHARNENSHRKLTLFSRQF
jgi:DNA replication protein DnaC